MFASQSWPISRWTWRSEPDNSFCWGERFSFCPLARLNNQSVPIFCSWFGCNSSDTLHDIHISEFVWSNWLITLNIDDALAPLEIYCVLPRFPWILRFFDQICLRPLRDGFCCFCKTPLLLKLQGLGCVLCHCACCGFCCRAAAIWTSVYLQIQS